MGRRRWKFITIAAFLLFMIKDSQSQDENDFYYTPVERSYAQVQPPLFPSRRPTTFFDNGENFRVAQPSQQPLYNEGDVRFPSPNYNQNPSPFQLPTGRSQSGAQYYLNQPDYTATQRQRFRPALPYNFQMIQPATTKRPDLSQIHSVAYQNDPSKPETFLGQITINNPDIDYLQHSRFKNIPFDSNSLKNNGQSGYISHDEEDNQDLIDHPRVTTYNPNKNVIKQRLNIRPNNSRYNTPYDPLLLEEKAHIRNTPNKIQSNNNLGIQKTAENLTENKAILDLEPLLEDEISDMSSFKELMKNTQGSFDVQVIKSHNDSNHDSGEDSKPDASSMNSDNLPKDVVNSEDTLSTTAKTLSSTIAVNKYENSNVSLDDNNNEEIEDDGEYVEYYDETESSENSDFTTIQPEQTDHASDIYDEYDISEELEKSTEETQQNITQPFDVLSVKQSTTMSKEDNFKDFIDTPVIDQEEHEVFKNKTIINDNTNNEEITSVENPSILGQEVVSVVTTKSVVNGTISIPDVTYAPSTVKIGITSEINQSNDTSQVTTENWVVVASVQTSRSVSGARFLPFPTVEQEEKKQVLTDEKEENEEDETVTKDPRQETNSTLMGSSSTENINDKLDSIQSELSSSVLSGSLNNENKNIELIMESTTETSTTSTVSTTTITTTTTTQGPLNVFTLKSTQAPNVTERSAPEPLPVHIKKFSPRTSTSTTPKPRNKPSLVTVMDELPPGFLPPGYKPRLSFKDKRTSTTPSTTTTSTSTTEASTSSNREFDEEGPQGRSSGHSSKNKVIVLDDKSLLPKEHRLSEKPQDDLLKNLPKVDISKFLPPGYKPPASEEEKPNNKTDLIEKVTKVDITSFLPKGFRLNTSTTEKPKINPKLPIKSVPDIAAFLPPGFKLNTSEKEEIEIPLKNIKIGDISNLLPPGFKLNDTEVTVASSSTTKAPGGIKIVFPSRLGSKTQRKTTPRPNLEMGPVPVTPKIMKGWPTRATTEFTGWPTSSTTPFSIEKFLNKSNSTTPTEEVSTEAVTRRTTTTTTTTTVPPPSTTPGVCRRECDIAGTIKIIAGVQWVPELLDHNTEEWQNLANDVKEELNSVYSNSDLLKKWYKGIRIDGFSQGSVLVDYFIELNDVEEKVDTVQLKKLFHKSLHEARPGSVVETVETESKEIFDSDVMLGDQPDEDRMKKSNEKMTKTIDKSAGKLEIGKFVMDPAYTEFIVLPKREEPTVAAPEEESFLPQWGIAVIVIAMASLLFVVIFGVTVLVNRQKSAKAKQPIPLSEDMLRELDKSHMGGFDDVHQMKERDLPYLPSGKRVSSAFIEQLSYPNPGDSWRSEWTPQLQKYMQHYTPDSGRGSQIYGTTGNAYGYGGSQLYGQTGAGGGGSQVYGYTGEYPRTHYSRRRSDYDSNF